MKKSGVIIATGERLVFLFWLCFFPLSSLAQSLERGLTEYEAGEYQSAFIEWLPLAKRGDASAQYSIGVMYREGKLSEPDHTLAYMWFNLAATSGNRFFGSIREHAASKLTAEELAKAQQMARVCFESNYQHCGY